MIELRAAADQGRTEYDWLHAYHHFCFAGYQSGDRLEWGRLRVLNRTTLAAHSVLKPSFHSDVEIILLVENGSIECARSDGTSMRIGTGDAAAIYAGIGIELTLSNPLGRPARFTTVWLSGDVSSRRAIFRSPVRVTPGSVAIASGIEGDRRQLSLKVPARLMRHDLARNAGREIAIATGKAYLLVLSGCLEIRGLAVQAHDGLAIEGEQRLSLLPSTDASILLLEV